MWGARYLSNEVTEQLLVMDETGPAEHDSLTALTAREMDLLRLITDENPTRRIAKKLFI